MARFDIYIPYLTNFEGGYVNDHLDRGGETNMGITLNTYKGYCKIVGKPYSYEEFRNMDISLRNEIIKKVFWDNCKADEIVNQSVAMAIVDWSINSGGVAVKEVQKLLKLHIDGIVGKMTLAAINGADQERLFKAIIGARMEYLHEICRITPTNNRFLKGWINRVGAIKFAK